MKILLTLLLLVPNLSWGSEEKARELYVKAEVEFGQSGCSILEFKKQISEVSFMTNELLAINELNDTNSIKLRLIDLIRNNFNPTIDYFDKCIDPYLISVQPKYEKIVNDYPSTEVALTIIRKNDYVTKEEADEIKKLFLTMKDHIDYFKEVLDINDTTDQIEYTLNNCIKVKGQDTKITSKTDYWHTWSYKITYENSCPINFSAVPSFTFLDSDEFILHEAFIFENIIIPANSTKIARGTEDLRKDVSIQVSMTSSGLSQSPY